MQFAVVSEHFDPWDLDVLAPLLQDQLGLPAYDAKHRARQARGIVADELERGQAEVIAAVLSRQCEVVVLGQNLVGRLCRPRRVQRLVCEVGGLAVPRGYGELRSNVLLLPWERIELVSGGAVRVVEQLGDEGVVPATRGDEEGIGQVWRSRVRTAAYDEIRADVVARGGPGEPDVRLRLVATQLVYGEILGEEAIVDPEESAVQATRDNFRLVLARIGRRARWADVPPPTVALIAAERLHPHPPEATRFDGDAEFDAFNRWRLAWHRRPD